MYGSLTNLSLNGHTIDLNRLAEDPLSSKLKAELDRSIAKHLEAGNVFSCKLILCQFMWQEDG